MSVKLEVYNKDGKKIGSENVPESIFDLPMNDALVYQAYTVKLANRRRSYAHTKTRADVRGGGRKPWRQKGTGRARHGSRRSPIWVGGGVTFGPRNERVFSKKLNKKMNSKAIATVLSSKLKEGAIFVVDSLDFKEPKTKQAASVIDGLKIGGTSTIVYGTKDDKNFKRVFRNIEKTNPSSVDRLNVVDILEKKNIVMSKSALDELVSRYSKNSDGNEKKEKSAKKKKPAKKKVPAKK
ncbi:MAG: 50S ribosomal protein L4 [Candidatus Spechtbacterales bacterium]|nr:50S ribosomal protein L4 [Candidatus Spechtbacterales bacterium]